MGSGEAATASPAEDHGNLHSSVHLLPTMAGDADDQVSCPHCGWKNPSENGFCDHCHKRLEETDDPTSLEDEPAARAQRAKVIAQLYEGNEGGSYLQGAPIYSQDDRAPLPPSPQEIAAENALRDRPVVPLRWTCRFCGSSNPEVRNRCFACDAPREAASPRGR